MSTLQRLRSQLFFLAFLSIIIASCYNCSQEDPRLRIHNNHLEEFAYDARAGPFDNGGEDLEDLLIMMKTDVASRSERLGEVDGRKLPTSAMNISIDDFGAKADGRDDTKAFKKTWKAACSSKGATLVVPEKNYLLKPLRLSGPCKSNLTVQILGTIEAFADRSDYKKDKRHWLVFENVDNLVVAGGGTIDGNGSFWWQNSCKVDKHAPCEEAPTALTFYKCKNLVVKDLKIQNGQQMHVSFQKSTNVQVSNIRVDAPRTSPNTDGIHVTQTQNIQITNSVIGTGDDCISIESGSHNVEATNITCGPGHGISIGSLGSENTTAHVSEVTINGAKLFNTANGVRIKTYQGGSGNATNIKFENIEMQNVTNPIIIDQYYCDHHKPCKEQESAVQISDVVYKNINGTSASEVAIKFDCSKTYPCQGIVLQDVQLIKVGGKTPQAICNNVVFSELNGIVSPCCPSDDYQQFK